MSHGVFVFRARPRTFEHDARLFRASALCIRAGLRGRIFFSEKAHFLTPHRPDPHKFRSASRRPRRRRASFLVRRRVDARKPETSGSGRPRRRRRPARARARDQRPPPRRIRRVGSRRPPDVAESTSRRPESNGSVSRLIERRRVERPDPSPGQAFARVTGGAGIQSARSSSEPRGSPSVRRRAAETFAEPARARERALDEGDACSRDDVHPTSTALVLL